jgi:hypothetical protein
MSMNGDSKTSDHPLPDGRWSEELEFRLVFVAIFVIFFTAALVSRLVPWRWEFGPRAEKRMSIIEKARETSSTMTGLAFMG